VITGITGYVGSQVCLSFLKDGSFSVRGTVRDPNNAERLAPLKKAYGDELFSKIELAQADLLDAESLDKAVAGCDYVVHTASPLPIKMPEDENVLIKPAVEGTLAVVRAAHKHKVKRVVVTSSGLTISVRKRENHKDMLTEADWSDVEICPPYDKSKLLAERAAWDYWNGLPADDRFELVVVIPGLIQGPTLITGEFSSMNYMRMLMMGVMPALPKVMFPIVDIRDVAQAHLNAIKVPEARNQRFICVLRTFRFKELCEILQKHFGEKYPIKTVEME
jgi:nucleoside-diphosphate-sugar epimerase